MKRNNKQSKNNNLKNSLNSKNNNSKNNSKSMNNVRNSNEIGFEDNCSDENVNSNDCK